MTEVYKYKVNLINFYNLINVTIRIDKDEKWDLSALSPFHWQTIKARMIIFELPEVIVAKNDNEYILEIITTLEFYHKQDFLKNFLKKINVSITKESNVLQSTFIQAFAYTLWAKMSPTWNVLKTEKYRTYLIEGRSFLIEERPLNAVDCEVTMESGNEIVIKIEPLRIKFPPCKLDDFHLSPKILQERKIYKCLPNYRLCVLPSFYKAESLSVCKNIPLSCPFGSYNVIRRHFKNMYGYRLPMTDENIFYIQMKFEYYVKELANVGLYKKEVKILTYPNICLRPNSMKTLQLDEPHIIINKFLADVKRKLSKMCGVIINNEEETSISSTFTQHNISLCTSYTQNYGESNN